VNALKGDRAASGFDISAAGLHMSPSIGSLQSKGVIDEPLDVPTVIVASNARLFHARYHNISGKASEVANHPRTVYSLAVAQAEIAVPTQPRDLQVLLDTRQLSTQSQGDMLLRLQFMYGCFILQR